MYHAIKDVKSHSDYLLILTFSNGEKRQFDMKRYLQYGIFQELRDKALFNTVRTCFDTIAWDNEADFDPEVLYQKSIKVD
ncbi:MAG: DUF2442 domain-containing protein [Bacteroidales bacterium]|nr:DUF2442 domain-containing protein [Bacteroidales bacterium]